jgi:multidrug efflux system outer membrane protein
MFTGILSKRKTQLTAAVVMAVILGSCMLGPNFQKYQYRGPDKFRFDTTKTGSTVNLRWWDLMDDPVLDTLIMTSLRENKDVLIAAERIEAAKANIGYTKAGRWPSFNVAGGVSGSGVSGNTKSGFQIYPEFTWEIGFWGKFRRMNEAARANYLASEYAKQMVQLSLVSAVASTYYSLLAYYDLLQISQSTLASRDSGLVIMMDKYEGGMISLMDFNQAKIQRDVAAAMVPAYERMIGLTENSLSILLGGLPHKIDIGKPFHKHEYELSIPVGLPSELLKRRPDVLMSEQVYKAANAQIGVAEAMRWPSLSLTGMLGAASTDLASLNAIGLTWSAGASIFSPLFQFGKNKRRVEIAAADARVALLDYETTVQTAFKDVEDALINIRSYRKELKAQESRAFTSIESEKLAYIRYNEGSTTYLEVLEQQRSSFSAQIDVLNTRLSLLNSYILLYKALGGGWITPEQEAAGRQF